MRRLLAPLLLLAACAFPVRAQEAVQPEWSEIETVTVRAQPGPALWHLTRGQSEVWVLGQVWPMPKGLEWNSDVLADVMDGAREVLHPPRPSINFVDVAWFLIWHGGKLSLPRGQNLETQLPDDLRRRFLAARDAAKGDAGAYATDVPIRAAVRLQQDFMKARDFEGGQPRGKIGDIARRHRIERRSVTNFQAMDVVRDLLKLSPEQQRQCLSQAVDDVLWASTHAEPAARAWAVGNVEAMKAHYAESRLMNCAIGSVTRAAQIEARNISETVTAIDAALKKPGKTVAIVNLGPLLRKGGVLEKLAAMGVAIQAPAES
ncbi:MAG: TraB/GumN family protein [Pseudomonadota bacterium]